MLKSNSAAVAAVLLPSKYRLNFATCYAYSPKGESETSKRSRQLCVRVKNGAPQWLRSYAARLCQEVTSQRHFSTFFNEHTLLVPVPNSPAAIKSSHWVARRLAQTLKEAGLAEDVWTGLRRIKAVEKSALAWMWERPTVQQHYQSFAVTKLPRLTPTDILLIDDVITKGRTLVAAALKLQEAFPTATVRAFALIRTMGLVLDVERVFDPCEGVIRWTGEDAYRDP